MSLVIDLIMIYNALQPVAQSKPPPPVTQTAKEAQNVENVKKWTPEHVAKWLDKNQLSRYVYIL